MAVLDLETVTGSEAVSVNVQVEGGNFILCNLSKTNPQTNLDLIFSEGEKIKFFTTGKGNVHLTGYTMPDETLDDMLDEDFSEDESIDIDDLKKKEVGSDAIKRKNTETLKLTGKDAKKLKTNDTVSVETSKVIDIDPKQIMEKKKTDNKPDQQKNKQQANQQKNKQDNQQKNKVQLGKLGTKDSDSEDDDG